MAGIATANADKSTASAVIVYDSSIFDTSSISDEGRYKFSLKEDGDEAAMDAEGGSGSADAAAAGSGSTGSGSEEDSSMIKIDDAPVGIDQSASEDLAPSLDGPAS